MVVVYITVLKSMSSALISVFYFNLPVFSCFCVILWLFERDALQVLWPTWRRPSCGFLTCTRCSSSLIRVFLENNLSKECCVPPYSVPLTSIKRPTLKGIATALSEVLGDCRIALDETVSLSKGIDHPLYQKTDADNDEATIQRQHQGYSNRINHFGND
ncbi:hypothetical protein SUGI_0478010, partial [Cryptomeria japonica]